MSEILMISKPIVPPYDDSAKNIVFSQVTLGERHRYRILATADAPSPSPRVTVAPIYGGAGAYSPGLAQNLRVMGYGLRRRGAALYHYFFAPNPVTSTAGRLQRAITRVKSVQTVCSIPGRFDTINSLLFSDKVIVLSEDTKSRMAAAGVDENRLVHIYPGIAPIERADDDTRRRIRQAHGVPDTGAMVLFPGDYEFSSAADTVARAVPRLAASFPDLTVVFACRIKRPPSLAERDRIRRRLAEAGLDERVVFLERVENMPAFVGAADVVVLPSESLFAKMDIPLVLLEAAAQQVPLVLADVPPLRELLRYGVGLGVPPADEAALADAVGQLLDNKKSATEMGEAGRAAVHDVFSAKKMADAVERVYDEVIEQ